MKYTIQDFTLELIDEPVQKHVVKWEKTSRKLRNEDAKPELSKAIDAIKRLSITESDPEKFVSAYRTIAAALEKAFDVLNNNEVLTVSANHGVIVKAAMESGWIISPEMTADEIDELPAWKVTWMAEKVGELYLAVTQVPKN